MKKNNNLAFLIIDLQNGLFSIPDAPPIYNGTKLISNIVDLVNKARKLTIPIIYIQHCSQPGGLLISNTKSWEIRSEVAPVQGDLIITKKNPDSFQDTRLKEELEKRNIEKLVITGLQTECCIDTTCRRAFSLGYQTTLVMDGHSTMDSEVITAETIIEHHNSILGAYFCDLKPTIKIDFK